jgi:hypothetical protein
MIVTVCYLNAAENFLSKLKGLGGRGLGFFYCLILSGHGSCTWPAIRDFRDDGQLYTCTHVPAAAAAGMAII